MGQYKIVSRKRGNQLWITIPKEIVRKNKINLKSKLDVLVSKNLIIITKSK